MAFLPLLAVGLGAAGSVMGGISQANAASYQAQVARNNAVAARQNAQYAAGATSANITQAGLKDRAQGANLKASIAANNLDVNTGSPSDVETSQREIGALDTANTAMRGANQVYGYETQATSFEAQAKLDQSQVLPDILGGVFKGAGSLLSGAPQVPSLFNWMTQSGGGGGVWDETSAET